MTNCKKGQTGTLKKPYLGYRHVEFCGVRLSAGSRAILARVSKSACGRMKLSGMNIMNNMKRQVSMVAMSYLSDVQALINLGEPEIARREVNFVKTLILDYPDMAAEVTDEELDGIYGRLCRG